MKIRKSIFTKLIGSFAVYAVVMVITLLLCTALEAVWLGEGDPTGIMLDSMIDKNGNVVGLDILEKLGGWVEELDDNYNVIAVYGDKQTSDKSYTSAELLDMTSSEGESEHIGFFIKRCNGEKNFLCLYRREVMQINATIIINQVDYNSVPVFLVVFLLLSLLEIILISLYLKRKIKNPLDKIVEGMEDLKSGNEDARINIRTEAEFENIVDTFNVMAEQLQTEKAEKEQLTQKKNRMLLELSHDIKTPVATIKSYANALEVGLVPEEKVTETYRIIDAKANRVQKLTDDMFMMLKMDDPDYRLNPENVDLSEYLRQLCAEYYDEITEAGFGFEIDIPERKIAADIDTDLFSRVVGNLISNAKKYNQTGSTISVKLWTENDNIYFAVSDDGDEIDKNFSDQMFNAFSRGDKARKTDGGTGLGLAISRIIIEKHGGKINYRRNGQWNIFEVKL